jgi:ketosteroid isomerase-like protein
MTQHPAIFRYIRAARAFNENDLATAKEFFNDEIVYRVPGRSPIAGEYRGIDEYSKLLQRLKELTGGESTIEPKIVLADDKSLVVYGHVIAKRGGKRYDNDQAYLFRLGNDGKAIEGRVNPVDLYAFDEFWS